MIIMIIMLIAEMRLIYSFWAWCCFVFWELFFWPFLSCFIYAFSCCRFSKMQSIWLLVSSTVVFLHHLTDGFFFHSSFYVTGFFSHFSSSSFPTELSKFLFANSKNPRSGKQIKILIIAFRAESLSMLTHYPLFPQFCLLPKDLIFWRNIILKRFRLLVFQVGSSDNRPHFSRLGIITNYRNNADVNIVGGYLYISILNF